MLDSPRLQMAVFSVSGSLSPLQDNNNNSDVFGSSTILSEPRKPMEDQSIRGRGDGLVDNNNSNNTIVKDPVSSISAVDAAGTGGWWCRGFTVPLWLLFVLQSLVVIGAFLAVILVLVLQQQDQITTSVFAEISLRQERSSLVILAPLLAREERFKALRREILNEPEMWFEDTMNQSSDAARRFFNFTYYVASDDPIIYTVFQHIGHSTLRNAEGDRLYGVLAMSTGPSSSLVTVSPSWNADEISQAYVHFNYPLTYDMSLSYEVIVQTAPWSVALRKQTYAGWARGGVVFNALSKSFTIVAGLMTPLVYNASTDETTLSFGYGFNVSFIASNVDAALLAPTSKLLLYDGVSDLIMSSRNTGQTDFNEAINDVWHLDTFPDQPFVERYREFVAGRFDFSSSNVSTWVSEEHGDDIVSLLYMTTEYGYKMHLFQITPRDYYFADGEKAVDIGIAIGFVAGVVVLVTCIVISLSVRGPVKRLRENMELAAMMRNDEVSDTSSLLTELDLLSKSFTQMNDKLLQARAFMPQSMLVGSVDNDCGIGEGENEEGGIEEGSISIQAANSMTIATSRHSTSTGGDESKGAATTDLSASHQSESSPSRGGISPQQQMIRQVVSCLLLKKVGVLVVNARGTHKLAATGGASLLERETVRLVELVERCARDEKGVVDAFQGDHFVLTFNAVRSVGSPGRNASLLSLNIQKKAQRDGLALRQFSMGLSVGRAYIGNVGSTTMKKNCTIGAVFTHAVGLEGLARDTGRTCVFHGGDVQGEVGLVSYCQLLGSLTIRDSTKESTLYAVSGKIEHGPQDEWLYELEAARRVNPYIAYNEAMSYYLCGETYRCLTSLDAAFTPTTTPDVLVNDISVLRSLASTTTSSAPTTGANGDMPSTYQLESRRKLRFQLGQPNQI